MHEGRPFSTADDEISVKEESDVEVTPKRKIRTKNARGPAPRTVENDENEDSDEDLNEDLNKGDENSGGMPASLNPSS